VNKSILIGGHAFNERAIHLISVKRDEAVKSDSEIFPIFGSSVLISVIFRGNPSSRHEQE
jgi:hypothetical protein